MGNEICDFWEVGFYWSIIYINWYLEGDNFNLKNIFIFVRNS